MLQSWMTLRVAAKRREATDIYSFELVDPEGRELPPFTAGAHVDVEVAPGLVRQYSLCNAPHRRDAYTIGVLRDPASRGGSIGMIDQVHAGQAIRVSDPRNHFALDPAARHSVLIAGGVGITPILCMAERLSNIGASFELHYAARSADRAAFLERIAAAPFAGQAHLHFDDGPRGQRLDLAAILARPKPDAHLYVCGPGGLIEAALKTAKAKGWPDARVHREFFTPPATTADRADPSGFTIKLASSGRTFQVPADKTIADVLEDADIHIPLSCQQGMCGTCVTGVLEGEPDHRDCFLTPEEQALNDQITLCCSRSKTALLVLDL